jgi:hypothetical protein
MVPMYPRLEASVVASHVFVSFTPFLTPCLDLLRQREAWSFTSSGRFGKSSNEPGHGTGL